MHHSWQKQADKMVPFRPCSWNKNLTHKRGAAMGAEFKKKGVNVLLGPVVGPIGRVVSGGRNWEALSPDPYLSGVLVYESVDAIQGEGVITSTKVRVATGSGPFAHDRASLTIL